MAVVVVLNLIGLVMVLSASSVVSIEVYGSAWRVFERQLMWTTVGGLAFVVASRLDYHLWQRWTVWITGLAALLCTVVLVPGIGIVAGGSRRWLGVGWFGFQPSELAKLAPELAGRARIAFVDVDAEPEIAAAFEVRGIPALFLVKDGEVVDSWTGYLPHAALKARLEQTLGKIGG
ncbi:MAG: hypothetical protein EBU70_11190 [Actinobacteria bacterium]|nr:hypothetical protein [Actinomycetota bacterium]